MPGARSSTRGAADGRIARPTRPPAIRKQPTATSTSGGGRKRRASGRAASAATGTTDTVRAAAAGEWPQPSTRSRTSRNSAAVSAADSRARVRLGRTAGRCRSGVSSGAARTTSAAGTASTANGTCTTKMACHENASVSSPPATGPVAVPTTPAVTQVATPRRSPYSATSSSRHPTSASAPPSACTHRAAISASIDRRQRAPRRGAGEHRDADGTDDLRARPSGAQGRRHGAQPQHEVERDQHPGDLPDGGVQVPEDVGQCERHHRGVREHQCHCHREQRTHGTTHRDILAARPTRRQRWPEPRREAETPDTLRRGEEPDGGVLTEVALAPTVEPGAVASLIRMKVGVITLTRTPSDGQVFVPQMSKSERAARHPCAKTIAERNRRAQVRRHVSRRQRDGTRGRQ